MSENPYTTPTSNPQDENSQLNQSIHTESASRGSRLGAAFIDGIIMTVITMPIMFLTGGFDGFSTGVVTNSHTYNLLIGLLGIAAFIAINFKFLINDGQTIGKRVLGIKIVDLEGNTPTLKQHYLKRYGFYFLIGQIPAAGQWLSTINVLFIFGKEKRCLHDLIAKTRVISTK